MGKTWDEDLERQADFFIGSLTADNPQLRRDAWLSLGMLIWKGTILITWALMQTLKHCLLEETDARVMVAAEKTLLIATLELVNPEVGDSPRTLEDWFRADLHQRSLVLRVADPERLRRDEDAVIELARSFPWTEFPATEFLCVDPGGYLPTVDDLAGVKAIVFVGRLSLFGKQAVEDWAMKRQPPRYRFGLDFRPAELPRGELHREYHAVLRTDQSSGEPPYRTADIDKVRTDYGLIRRYVVSRGGRLCVVIHVAGSSSLGTLAAARFAAHLLFRYDVDGKPIPLPAGIGPQSHLEALVEAKANTEGSNSVWKPDDYRLLDLRVDDSVWSQTDFRWDQPTHKEISLIFPPGVTRDNYRQEEYDGIEVFFDGERADLHAGGENRRLCIALCLRAANNDGTVDLVELGGDNSIWADKKTKSVQHTRNRLGNLRRYFKESLQAEGNTCRILARVTIDQQNPNKPR